VSKPDTTSSSSSAPEGLITIEITPTMEREFMRRGMFPELRLENALRIVSGATGVYRVSLARASEVLADADALRQWPASAELPRGATNAYSALARKLKEMLRREARRGLWDDPGIDEARRRMTDSPARFAVGDTCLFFHDDAEEYGHKVKIVGAFDVYFVTHKEGRFIRPDGARGDYRQGYRVAFEDDPQRYIVFAWQLTRDDCKPSYLSLVAGLDVQRAHSHA
jgi:hypothetical protein